MNTSSPLLFLSLVANRQLTPAAVLLAFGGGDPDVLAEVLAEAECAALLEEFPVFMAAQQARGLPPELLVILKKAGVHLQSDELVEFSSHQKSPTLPLSAKWLSGDWYLAPDAALPDGKTKPTSVRATAQNTSSTLALQLLQLVTADADLHEIEEIFRRDPALAYHLLRIVNSVGVGSGKKISSLAQAILILGRQQLKRWLSLMLFAAGKKDGRSAMLLARAAVRARSMEMLAKSVGLDKSRQELAFMAGMFSLLGVLFGQPLAEILKPLQISSTLVDALLRHENDLGQLLRVVELAESHSLAELLPLLAEEGLSPGEFNTITAEAHLWTLRFVRTQEGAVHG